ncbi:hypothetical protein BJ508DRAFT_357552 [Ascobolus immersus RN42]|uniref:Uncharacterized protein n=1 Tax=Ascobolus immersus RN42 TaxID=1160509 RepID=A0A3N4IMJ6_ASCIM|nr:hypothetical protein BJ508DRAFT_357552 [Ascobolus immersus RN42]
MTKNEIEMKPTVKAGKPRCDLSLLRDQIWSKGLVWAFEVGLIQVVTKGIPGVHKSGCPERHALILEDRLKNDARLGYEWPSSPAFILGDTIKGCKDYMEYPNQKDSFIVRECYYELFRRTSTVSVGRKCKARVFEGAETKAILLTGQSHVGKSTFLTFALVMRLLLGQPTAYQHEKPTRFGTKLLLLTEEGCYYISSQKDKTRFDLDRSVLALCDSEPEAGYWADSKRIWPIVYASPPHKTHYADFIQKQPSTKVLFMDIWTHPELLLVNSCGGCLFSNSEMAELSKKFKPSPSLLEEMLALSYQNQHGISFDQFLRKYEKDLISKAAIQLAKAKDSLSVEDLWLGCDTDGKFSLAVMRPVIPGVDGKMDRITSLSSHFRIVISTDYLYHVLSQAAAAVTVNIEQAGMFFRMVQKLDGGRVSHIYAQNFGRVCVPGSLPHQLTERPTPSHIVFDDEDSDGSDADVECKDEDMMEVDAEVNPQAVMAQPWWDSEIPS